jgi:hypothetical protein
VGCEAVEGFVAGGAETLAWFVDFERGEDALLQPRLTAKTRLARRATVRALRLDGESQMVTASLLSVSKRRSSQV